MAPWRICSATSRPRVVHRPAAVADLGRDGLGLVDRRLGRLELLALLDDRASTRRASPSAPRVRLGNGRRGRTADEGAIGRCARNHGAAEQEGQPALHEADATVSPATCLASAASFPSGATRRGRLRPKEARGNVIDYEILLLLDAELPDERQNEIVTRTRELVERDGGTFESHDAVGSPPARLRDRPQARGRLPPAHLLGRAGNAGRDLARAQDHGRRHAPHGGQAAEARRRPVMPAPREPPSSDREPEYAEPELEQPAPGQNLTPENRTEERSNGATSTASSSSET